MHITIDLEWMHALNGPNHKIVRPYGIHLMAVTLRSICMFRFSERIHCRTLHGTTDIELRHGAANRRILYERQSLGPDGSTHTSGLLPGAKKKNINLNILTVICG